MTEKLVSAEEAIAKLSERVVALEIAVRKLQRAREPDEIHSIYDASKVPGWRHK